MTRAWVCERGHRSAAKVWAWQASASTSGVIVAMRDDPPEVIPCPERIAARTTCGARARLVEEPAPQMPGREPA